jgi:hypothetical protein
MHRGDAARHRADNAPGTTLFGSLPWINLAHGRLRYPAEHGEVCSR